MLSSLPVDILKHLCRLLTPTFPGTDLEVQQDSTQGCTILSFFALRSCSKLLRACCDDVRESVAFETTKLREVEMFLSKLPRLSSVRMVFGSGGIYPDNSLNALHSILPRLESLSLIYKYNDESYRVLETDNNNVVLWSQTLLRLQMSWFSVYDNPLEGHQSLSFISQLSNLQELDLSDCQPDLKSEVIKHCTSLLKLTLRHYPYMPLVDLDLSGCTLLQEVICTDYNIQTLVVGGLTSLKVLECTRNRQLTVLDVSACTALTGLICRSNSLQSLDTTVNKCLQILDCSNNPIRNLRLSGSSVLRTLFCDACNDINLDMESCTGLRTLHCMGLGASRLDLKACTALQTLYADYCTDLLTLNMAGMRTLKVATFTRSSLTSLVLSECEQLEFLDCQGSQMLTSLLLSGCTKLEHLCVANCGKLALNLTGCTNLSFLHCN